MFKPGITLLALAVTAASHAATVDLRIMETTDLHSNMMDFDYYKDTPTEKFGLVRTATLINAARAEVKNSVLVDNGDIIQGSPLGDYMAAKGLGKDEVHPVYKAMNTLDYSVGNLGNHEFNYGLDYLHKALSGAHFPYVNANIIDSKTHQPLFTPYLIKATTVTDRAGKTHRLNIGYIGFVPPQIMVWDKANLQGNVTVNDITETARHYVPEMRSKGADIIVAIPHSGLSSEPYHAMAENSVYYLSQVPGIDAIMFGHAHAIFPSDEFKAIKGADIAQGTLNGVPAVMPGMWGDHLGVVDLVLESKTAGGWQISSGKAEARPIYDKAAKKSLAGEDQALVNVLADAHKATRDFVAKPIGRSADVMYSYLSLIQDDPTVQIVNNAQRDYVERFIQGDPDLARLPVLSAAAPFKAGGRKNDPASYVEVEKGALTFRNAADLYLYPNTLVVLKVTGAEVKEWLECSAGQFNQIDTTRTEPQSLINRDFRTYNFDVIDGVNYQIDVTQPARYNNDCKLINAGASRIHQLTFNGKPIDPAATFLVATNNYRATGGSFAGTGESHIAFASPDENRSVVAAYISAQTKAHGEVHPQADNNWRLAAINSSTPLDIRFETAPGEKATRFIKDYAQYPLQPKGNDAIGFALWQVNLQQPKP